MSLRQRAGALVYDWPNFLRHIGGDWTRIRNRDERIVSDGRGVRCEWAFTSNLHLPAVYPSAGHWLMRRALAQWPIAMRETPAALSATPEVTFLIGHRGVERLPNLLATLRSIAGQEGVGIECIVIEQSARREIERELPSWVRYLHTPVAADFDYCRAATFNDGLQLARGSVLVLHDNDMLLPSKYAFELAARARDGAHFIDLKRFIFYLEEAETRRIFDGGALRTDVDSSVVQNLRGGSVAATTAAYRAIGGFDEEFVGWGGEDNEFWERAEEHGGVYAFGYLPIVHLWHRPQKGKETRDAPAQRRYYEIRSIPPAERITRLTRSAKFSNEK
ncbi:MAG: hypothetical protein JO197_03780 [Acidobacteria bacterium]|nr:hypothetical protein [Acidobacteriota bacterium]MBV9476494.1 hypothetical protein [Acidobacteriota bacterium]